VRGIAREAHLGLRIAGTDGRRADPWRLFLRWFTKQYAWICTILFAATGARVFYMLGGFMNGVLIIGCFFAANEREARMARPVGDDGGVPPARSATITPPTEAFDGWEGPAE
jgi:hypothetical protein